MKAKPANRPDPAAELAASTAETLAKPSPERRTLLIVEDDLGLQSQLRWSFDDYEVLLAEDRETALSLVRRHEPAVVTLDLGLPPDPANATQGLEALGEILAIAPHTKVIVVTGNDDRENAVRAVGRGAYDFYQKPVAPEVLGLIIDRAYRLYDLEEENRRLSRRERSSPLAGVIAASTEMTRVCRMVEKVAPTDATVLVLGESGTGKELLARALHALSPRCDGRFIAINCAAIPETLLESELFGYEKGAFTGAAKQTLGKIEYASHGTLFLDEVGDLPQSLQAKLLRFLQERVIERVGGREEIPVDVRVVCATHQDLPHLIEDGRFREDLYYRISEISLRIPPLRDRTGDAVLLARHFLETFGQEHGRSIRGFTDDALAAIESYPWPGNARELENRVKRAVIMADGNRVTAEDLELGLPDEILPLNLRQVREEAERRAIERALALFNGNVSQAADILGVSRPTLYDLVKKYDLR
jgi:two-component system NtrC family response regulator